MFEVSKRNWPHLPWWVMIFLEEPSSAAAFVPYQMFRVPCFRPSMNPLCFEDVLPSCRVPDHWTRLGLTVGSVLDISILSLLLTQACWRWTRKGHAGGIWDVVNEWAVV